MLVTNFCPPQTFLPQLMSTKRKLLMSYQTLQDRRFGPIYPRLDMAWECISVQNSRTESLCSSDWYTHLSLHVHDDDSVWSVAHYKVLWILWQQVDAIHRYIACTTKWLECVGALCWLDAPYLDCPIWWSTASNNSQWLYLPAVAQMNCASKLITRYSVNT
jgi:hypothetical protein